MAHALVVLQPMNPLKSRKGAKGAEPQLLVASADETQGTIKVPHRLTEVLCKKTLEDKTASKTPSSTHLQFQVVVKGRTNKRIQDVS